MRDMRGVTLGWIARISLLLGVVLSLLASSASALASADRYIVVLKDGVDHPGQVAAKQALSYGTKTTYVYRSALTGYAATIPASQVHSLRANDRVAYVERDRTVSALAQTLPWGINRIDADISSTLAGNGSGAISNVRAYVIDTGIYRSHPDLNVVNHVNFAGGQNNDCNGHGTHVAGTVAARDNTSDVVGASPGLRLIGVKVLGCGGTGSISGVIKGVDWVTANAVKPAVANMSLGGGPSQALDDAVRQVGRQRRLLLAGRRQRRREACTSSPARAGAGTNNGIVTTAATNSLDQEASWSNYGSCVDLWAPGVSILSTRKGGGTTTMSGTSMASPHVAGTGALYLSSHTTTAPAQVESQLKAGALSPGTRSKDGRSIRLVYAGGY